MAHRSWCAEHPGTISNERLEFLGDAVLGWVVADLAYRRFSDLPEGALTGVRKGVVNALALADVAEDLGLGEFLLLGKGEDAAGGREKPSILSDALEAVFGAVYVDGGPERRLRRHRAADRPPPRRDGRPPRPPRPQVDACRSWRPGRVGRPSTSRGPRVPTTPSGSSPRCRRRPVDRRGHRPLEEGGRAGGRAAACAADAASLTPRRTTPIRAVPELPEVETVRRGLAAGGRAHDRAGRGRPPRTVRRTSAQEVVDGLTGATVLAAGRRGKYLLLPLDTGDTMMIHLRMSGQLLLAAGGAGAPPHTHVVLTLDRRRPQELWFVDPRTFGEVVVFDPDHVDVELPSWPGSASTRWPTGSTRSTLRRAARRAARPDSSRCCSTST